MRCLLLAVFVSFIRNVTCAIALEPGKVISLTDEDFESNSINDVEFALVEFFAPWCGHCKKLEPEFTSAAQQMKDIDPSVLFAAVDATTEKIESSRQGVRGFPTLKWYVNGVAVDYTGERNARSIVNWVTKKIGSPAEEVKSLKELEDFVQTHRVCVVSYINPEAASSDSDSYFDAARRLEMVPFAFTKDSTLRAKMLEWVSAGSSSDPAASAMVVFKKLAAGFKHNSSAFTSQFSSAAVEQFVRVEMLPRVVTFTELGMSDVFNGFIQKHLVFFGEFDAENLELFDQLAVKYRGDFVVVTVSPNEFRALDFFEVAPAELPAMRLLDLRTEPMYKYKFEGDIALEPITNYVNKFQAGALVPILKSEPIPETASAVGEVVKVVGQTFDQLILQSDKWVLLQISAPWCGHCKLLDPIWEELAKSRENDPRLTVATIDGTANEHLALKFVGFPSIQLWAPRTHDVTAYKSHRTLKDLNAFLDKVIGPLNLDEAASKDEL